MNEATLRGFRMAASGQATPNQHHTWLPAGEPETGRDHCADCGKDITNETQFVAEGAAFAVCVPCSNKHKVRVPDAGRVGTVEVGDLVRSFDFEGTDLEGERACYVEGVVGAIGVEKEGCPRYMIVVQRMVFGGEEKEVPIGHIVYPPVNGTPHMFGGFCNCVQRIS